MTVPLFPSAVPVRGVLVFALVALFASTALPPQVRASEPDSHVKELIHRADRVLRGKTSAAVVKMRIKTDDYDRSYDMVIWDDARKGDKSLVKILGPAMWRGYGTLKVGDRLLSYNPRNDHVTVVGSSMLGDAWMGSHFSNDDLVKETQLDVHYDYQIVKEWDGDGGAFGPARWYRLKLVPKPRAPVVWGAIEMVLYEQGDLVIPTTMAYFREDKEGAEPVRKLAFSDVEELGGRRVPSR